MKKFLIAVIIVVSSFGIMLSDSQAKRLGGGGSVGRQSSNVSAKQAPAQPAANQSPSPTTAGAPSSMPRPASPWRGMLGGALLGLGLGALLSSFGIGGGMASIISILLMVVLGFVLVRFLLRLFTPQSAPAPYLRSAYTAPVSYSNTPETRSATLVTPLALSDVSSTAAQSVSGNSSNSTGSTWQIPAGFDVAGYERSAKTYFIRLQAAWDKADINDIREFTTPEMFAEVKLQIQERGISPNVTDVITINARLLGIETQEFNYLASVQFTGTMKEAVDAPTESFDEIWNLSKSISAQSGWLLAGIQQNPQID